MPTPTATLVRDPDNGFPWGLSWSLESGEVGFKSYVVTTDDPDVAIAAPGLPAKFEAYHASKPGVLCVSIEAFPYGEACRVVCRFAQVPLTGGGGIGQPPPAPERPSGTKFTNIDSVNESVTFFSPINETTGDVVLGPRIAGGQGMPAYVGRSVVQVTRYYAPAETPDYALFNDLHNNKAVNLGNLTLPPMQGTTASLVCPDATLLYMGHRTSATPLGLPVVTHTLWYSSVGHKYKEIRTDKNGAVIATIGQVRYRKVSLAAVV